MSDRAPAPTLPAPPPPAILVVDDDHDFRLQMAEALRREGYLVRTASTGEEGLHALGEVPTPDLVVLDLGLPRMSGEEFLSAKGQYLRWARIPVVVVSGRIARSMPTGVRAALSKPADWEAILDAVHCHCPIVGRGGEGPGRA